MSKKIVFIIAQEKFQEIEYFIPRQVIEDRGFKVVTASKTTETATSKTGKQVEPDLALTDVKVKEFEGVVFVGGPGAAEYFEDQEALRLVQDFTKSNKIVAAICIAPSILANAGVLMGKTVTAFPSQEENIKNRGAEYTGMPVEVDGKIVTGKDPDAAKEFGEKIAYLLEE